MSTPNSNDPFAVAATELKSRGDIFDHQENAQNTQAVAAKAAARPRLDEGSKRPIEQRRTTSCRK